LGHLEAQEALMSKPSAFALFDPQHSQALPFETPRANARQPAPYLIWDEATATAAAAWLPQVDRTDNRKIKSKRFVVAAIIAVMAMVVLAAASRSTSIASGGQCHISSPPVTFGTNTETQMLVRGGLPCPIWTRIAGTSINELVVTRAPTNGTVTPRGRTGVIYRPAANYQGTDVFEFAMRGQSTSTLRVNVTVE
jgi:hypothetical protein